LNHYRNIEPIDEAIPASRQGAKRHYGVHPYFTRRPYNVIRKYILHYSKKNSIVVDPFGGSGVTAIEAFLENRTGIQNDINPLANFIARGIVNLTEGSISDYCRSLTEIGDSCEKKIKRIDSLSDEDIRRVIRSVNLPPNTRLPGNSDVQYYHDLFTWKQLASLAILKEAIDRLRDAPSRNAMLLAWSATLTKLNRTFLSARGRAPSRGGSSIFSIYRYKVAKMPIELPCWDTFYERASNVIDAKAEMDKLIELKRQTVGWSGRFEEYSLDIEELSDRFIGSVDYVFTDPPYGGNISYLDLSTLWNVWLDSCPSEEIRKKELIVGGELKIKEEDYIQRLYDSIRACLRMLKINRWCSVVFQHWNIDYFKAILSAGEAEGGELKAAVSQVGDPIWSMHKKKNRERVLSGEMILTFLKSEKKPVPRRRGSFDLEGTIKRLLDTHRESNIYGEYLFNRVIIEAWENSSIENINISKHDFIDILNNMGWRYDSRRHYWIKNQSEERMLFDL